MKHSRGSFLIISSSLLLGAAPLVWAADSVGAKIAETGDAQLPREVRSSLKSSEYTGQRVFTSDGKEIGSVQDFVVDARSGQVLYALVGSGGVLGMGGQSRAVPMSALQRSNDAKGFSLPVEEAKWNQAPTFQQSDVNTLSLDQRGRETFEFFGTRPDEEKDERTLSQPQLVLGSSVRGKEVKSGDREVGEADDLIVDFNSRRASILLDADDDFLGAEARFVVPMRQVSVARGDEDLTTQLQRNDFENAKPFDQMSWTGADGDSVYRWEARTIEVGQAISPQDAAATGDAALAGGPSTTTTILQTDTSPSERVRTALSGDLTLAGSVQDVRVEEEEGRIVLSGTVATEDVKLRAGDRARNAAGGGRVENRIDVIGR